MLRPEHLLLDIGRGLGLAPKEADHYIQRRGLEMKWARVM